MRLEIEEARSGEALAALVKEEVRLRGGEDETSTGSWSGCIGAAVGMEAPWDTLVSGNSSSKRPIMPSNI